MMGYCCDRANNRRNPLITDSQKNIGLLLSRKKSCVAEGWITSSRVCWHKRLGSLLRYFNGCGLALEKAKRSVGSRFQISVPIREAKVYALFSDLIDGNAHD
jgi:hypothetical protein